MTWAGSPGCQGWGLAAGGTSPPPAAPSVSPCSNSGLALAPFSAPAPPDPPEPAPAPFPAPSVHGCPVAVSTHLMESLACQSLARLPW